MLCGHQDYYPRFGYQNSMFSFNGSKLFISADEKEADDIIERPIYPSDLDWIIPKWKEIHKKDRLSIFPGDNISQWLNHSIIYRSSVLIKDEKILGYIKYRIGSPIEIQELIPLGNDVKSMLAFILSTHEKSTSGNVVISLSFDSCNEIIGNKVGITIEKCIYTNPCFMLKVLDEEDKQLNRYCIEATKDINNLGIIAFPAIMNIDD